MTLVIREYDEDHRVRERVEGDASRSATSAAATGPLCRAEYVVETGASGAEKDGIDGKEAVVRPLRPLRRRRSSLFFVSRGGGGDGGGGEDEGLYVALRRIGRHYLISAPRRVFVDLFLPLGYPHSVGDSYLSYQIYDSLQGICSYLRGVVSTSAVLSAAGVGDAEATAMSAAATWALRDGLGMIGGLLFSYFASRDFDARVKEWRLFADVVNDVGLTLDMIAPWFRGSGPGAVLAVTSLATVCKSMCGISAGATKASITHHFAVRGNMADLSAKEGTQETLVSLIGMVLGVALARYLHRLETLDDTVGETSSVAAVVSWSIFVALTVLHVWANYRGVKLLRLRSLNRQRAEAAFRGVVEGCAEHCCGRSHSAASTSDGGGGGKGTKRKPPSSLDVPRLLRSVPSPAEVDESLWSSAMHLLLPGKVRLGARLSDALRGMDNEDVRHCLEEEFRNERYILSVVAGGHEEGRLLSSSSLSSWRVCVTLRMGANEDVELKAFLHAMIAARCISSQLIPLKDKGKGDSTFCQRELIRRTHLSVNELFGEVGDEAKNLPDRSTHSGHLSLVALSDRGWDNDRLYLGFGPWRIQWEATKED